MLSRITLCQLLMTIALQFVSSSYESIGINLVPSVVFVMALFFRQEKLKFWSINGQGKIWGLVLSAAGALVLVLWEGPVLLTSRLSNIQATSDGVIGLIMIVVGVLATCFWNIMVVWKFLQSLSMILHELGIDYIEHSYNKPEIVIHNDHVHIGILLCVRVCLSSKIFYLLIKRLTLNLIHIKKKFIAILAWWYNYYGAE